MLRMDEEASGRLDGVVAAAANSLPPGTRETDDYTGRRIGNYLLVREVGEGGMGVVYQGIRADGEFHQAVAIKVIRKRIRSESVLRRFRQERHILARLDHPNIARMFDAGTTAEGLPFLVMDYIDGRPVTAFCEERGLDTHAKLKLFIEICEGVQHAHDRQVVHRDLKPNNILVTAEGRPKLLDFGIAKWLDPNIAPETAVKTATGFSPLTPEYASPEQQLGRAITERTDVFALGAVLFEMLTGEKASAYGPLARARLTGGLAPLLWKAMAPEPDERYSSAHELAEAVRRVMDHDGQTPIPGCPDDAIADGRAASRRPWWRTKRGMAWVAAVALASAAIIYWRFSFWTNEVRSVAVLPFVNLGTQATEDRVAEGLTEDIITQLALIPGLKVPSRTAVWQYRGKVLDPRDAGRALGVGTVLEGSVRRSGNRVRVVAQLIDVRDGFHLWAQSYDREGEDALAVQSAVSRLIGQDLQTRLSGDGNWNEAGRADPDGEAQRVYLEGYRLFQMDAIRREWAALRDARGIPPRMVETIRAFERATELDPQFAGAWAGLAEVTEWAASWSDDARKQFRGQAEGAARKALSLEPTNAIAMATMGLIYHSHDWDLRRAEPYLRQAVELRPRSTGLQGDYANCLVALGRYDEARELLERGQILEPGSPRPSGRLALLMAQLGDSAEARRYAKDSLGRDPRYRYAMLALAYADELDGNLDAAENAYREILRVHPTEDRTLASLGALLARRGRRGEAVLMGARLRDMVTRGRRREVFEAIVRTALGDRRTALTRLEQAWERHDPNLLNLELELHLAPLAGEPRFEAIKAKLRALR